jgi:hypothetical protein
MSSSSSAPSSYSSNCAHAHAQTLNSTKTFSKSQKTLSLSQSLETLSKTLMIIMAFCLSHPEDPFSHFAKTGLAALKDHFDAALENNRTRQRKELENNRREEREELAERNRHKEAMFSMAAYGPLAYGLVFLLLVWLVESTPLLL